MWLERFLIIDKVNVSWRFSCTLDEYALQKMIESSVDSLPDISLVLI